MLRSLSTLPAIAFLAPGIGAARPPDAPRYGNDDQQLADRCREVTGQIFGAAPTDVDDFRRADGMLATLGFILTDMPGRLTHRG